MAPPPLALPLNPLTNTALGVAQLQSRPRRAYTRGRFGACPPSCRRTSELRTPVRPPRKDERDAELVYLGGRAPGGPDRGRSSRSPRLPASAPWLSSPAAPVPHLTPAWCGQAHVAPCAFLLCLAADGGVGDAGQPWRLPAGEYLFLARTLQPRPLDPALYSGVSWAAGLGRGRRSRDRIPAPFRYCAGPGGLGLSVCPDDLRSPSKTFMVLQVIL